MSEITRMDEGGLVAAAQALSKAFHKDPLQGYTFPDASERREKSPLHFTAVLKYGLMFGEVYAARNGVGASIWLKPGETDVTPERAEASGLADLPEQIGGEAHGRFFTVISYCDGFHKTDATEPHWYTMVLGVDPEFQGQGFGRSLLKPVLERAKSDRVSVYLETAQPANVAFYKKMGFEPVRELNEPKSGLDLWTFRLDP